MIPTDKSDIEAIEKLQSATDAEVLQNSVELLNWLQDLNWPVFEGICNRLSKLGNELHSNIVKIFQETDSILKANIVGHLIPKFSVEAQKKYTKDLEKLLINLSSSDYEEGLIDFIEMQISKNDKSI